MTAPIGGSAGRRARPWRGAMLLELVLAMALFVGGGLAVLSAIGQAGRSLDAARERVKAADLARSAMARIEAGLADPVVINGPVSEWVDEEVGAGAAFRDSPTAPSGWELVVQTEPSEHEGLTRVSITARRTMPRGVRTDGPSFTLHQLVRLGAPGSPSRPSREGPP
jgi:hypothetical protein